MGQLPQQLLEKLDQLEEIFLDGQRIPFSGNRLVNEHEAIEILDEIRESIPSEINRAATLLKEGEEYIKQSKIQAQEIIQRATQERDLLVDSTSVRKEAERQIIELQSHARQKSEKILHDARKQACLLEQEMKKKISKQENLYVARREKLERQAIENKKQLTQENTEYSNNLKKQIENSHKKALIQLEEIRQESHRVQYNANLSAQKINNEASLLKQKTQQECDSLVVLARNEAAFIQDGANKYAEQTLKELEKRLQELNQVVSAGRYELNKIQGIKNSKSELKNIESQKAIPFRRLRSKAVNLSKAINSSS